MHPASPSRLLTVAVPVLLAAMTVAATDTSRAGTAAAPSETAPEHVTGTRASSETFGRERDARESADEAVRALGGRVKRSSHTDALRTAFEAYYSYRDANPDNVKKPYLYYVDMGLDNRTARGYVFDMEELTVVDGPFAVAHGRGSARTRDGVPASFSNRPGSNATSLGLYLAQETYTFSGKSGGRRYSSVGLRMRGESGEFNSAARRRGIVAHGAPYVTAGQAGRSEGCPAMEMGRAQRLLPMIANGGIVFIYSPNDSRWLRSDPWTGAL